MATKRIVPRATTEGGIGRSDKLMGESFFSKLGLSANVRFCEATVTTTNATATLIWESDALATGEALHAFVMVVGTDATGVTCGGYARVCTVRTPSTGPVLIGTDVLGTDNEAGVTTLNITAGVADAKLQIKVTGRAATTMTWRAFIVALYER